MASRAAAHVLHIRPEMYSSTLASDCQGLMCYCTHQPARSQCTRYSMQAISEHHLQPSGPSD